MDFSIIVAMDEKGGIGKDGGLPVDLAYFQRGLGVWEHVKPLHLNDRDAIVTS
jgi:hypothetical protein